MRSMLRARSKAQSRTSCPESGSRNGCQSVVWTMEKSAVLAPMPSASIATTSSVKPGARLNWRRAVGEIAGIGNAPSVPRRPRPVNRALLGAQRHERIDA